MKYAMHRYHNPCRWLLITLTVFNLFSVNVVKANAYDELKQSGIYSLGGMARTLMDDESVKKTRPPYYLQIEDCVTSGKSASLKVHCCWHPDRVYPKGYKSRSYNASIHLYDLHAKMWQLTQTLTKITSASTDPITVTFPEWRNPTGRFDLIPLRVNVMDTENPDTPSTSDALILQASRTHKPKAVIFDIDSTLLLEDDDDKRQVPEIAARISELKNQNMAIIYTTEYSALETSRLRELLIKYDLPPGPVIPIRTFPEYQQTCLNNIKRHFNIDGAYSNNHQALKAFREAELPYIYHVRKYGTPLLPPTVLVQQYEHTGMTPARIVEFRAYMLKGYIPPKDVRTGAVDEAGFCRLL